MGTRRKGALKQALSAAATDVVSGERVVFDTGRGDRIGPEHVMASCAFLPLFAPIEVEGRLLGDGGLSANAPLDLVLGEEAAGAGALCFVVDLFAREGSRPRHSLAASVARSGDLAFGNQSRRILEGQQAEQRLRAMIGRLARRLPAELRRNPEVASVLAEGTEHQARVVYLSYRAGPDEAGPGKMLDFSRATLGERWRAGAREMRAALGRIEAGTAAPPGPDGPGRCSEPAMHDVHA